MYEKMMFAIMSGDTKLIRKSIKKDKSIVTIRDKAQRTLLMEAAIFKKEDIARLLIENGADVNAQEIKGWSPLHFATQSNLPGLVKLLIEKGANLNSQDAWGNVPLLRALHSCDSETETVSILLQAGADKDKKNNYGVSPYELAMQVTNHDLKRFFK